ncbi:MAG: sensor histidine kinase [Dehalococcoidales bacterium]|nr:sensor histidine kinase [Dehalococcoidales bacterium]
MPTAQSYIAEITRAQEAERKRISCELHDETIQALFTIITDIEHIINDNDRLSSEDTRRLRCLQGTINHLMGGIRRFCSELRPGLLDSLGLVPSLELLVEEANRDEKLVCRLETTGCHRRLSSEIELVLFRVSQEALRNVRKYAGATEVIIGIDFGNRKVTLNICDNGCGFELKETLENYAHGGKLGLLGMRDRVYMVGGGFTVESEAGKGTRITAFIPIHSK